MGMSSKIALLTIWLTEVKRNLAEFQRSPFHDTLRTEIRDHYTNLFENFPKETLAKVEALLRAAKIEEPLLPSMSASRTLEGCWELKTHDKPKNSNRERYHWTTPYRFIPMVLNAELMGEAGSRPAPMPQQSLCVSRSPGDRLVSTKHPRRR